MLAKVILIGNLGRDPEIRQASNGDSYARVSLATNKVVKGEKQTQWWNVTVFDTKKAEVLSNYAKMGSKLYLEGELQAREYQAKDGTTKTSMDVVIGKFTGEMKLMSEKNDAAPTQQTSSVSNAEDIDDDIPF
jgi:single-strand DNA-binding protein